MNGLPTVMTASETVSTGRFSSKLVAGSPIGDLDSVFVLNIVESTRVT